MTTIHRQYTIVNPAGNFDGLLPSTGLIDFTSSVFAPYTVDPLNATGLVYRIEQIWISSDAAAVTFSGSIWLSDTSVGTPPGNNFAQVYGWTNRTDVAPFSTPGDDAEVLRPTYLGDGTNNAPATTGATLRIITQNAGASGVRAVISASITRTGPL